MKRISTFRKLFFSHTTIVILVSLALLLSSVQTVRTHYMTFMREHVLDTFANVIAPTAVSLFTETNTTLVTEAIREIEKSTGADITLVSTNGSIFANGNPVIERATIYPMRNMLLSFITQGNAPASPLYKHDKKDKRIYIARPLLRGSSMLGYVIVATSFRRVETLLEKIEKTFFFITLAMIPIALLLGFLFSRSFAKPLTELIAMSRRVAEGEFDCKVDTERKDDFRELLVSFNYMVEQIRALFSQISEQKEELTIMINSLMEGFLVLDAQGRITLANRSFLAIVKAQEHEASYTKKYYWDIVREPEFTDIVTTLKKEKRGLIREITLFDRIYLCSATLLPFKEEKVIIFHDITDIKNLEQMKKDFVVNVSHELRTPLTAIKGFVETLELEDKKSKHKRYVKIIKRNTDRLINIIEDLLLLSEMDEERFKVHLESTNLKKLIKNAIRIFEKRLEEKGVSLVLDLDDDVPKVMADAFKIEQTVVNLLDNAIKYTEEGAITVRLKKEGQYAVYEIEDTGAGIPDSDISKIFDRFYVVDKSRSRIIGGTGLGLSIVKQIIFLHNGEIRVQSKEGVGTTFSIMLPLSRNNRTPRSTR